MKGVVISMIAVLLCTLTRYSQAVRNPNFPTKRVFQPIKHSHASNLQLLTTLRVLQFNILADGLSGLRSDLGGFSRARREWLNWDTRKHMLLKEIQQYEPDIVTLQECDHYYDLFLPALAKEFDGIFAPKPASACLEVSQRSDGCAVFVRRSKLKIASTETITFALPYDTHPLKPPPAPISNTNINSAAAPTTTSTASTGAVSTTTTVSTPQHWKFKRLQNQVALVVECEIQPDTDTDTDTGTIGARAGAAPVPIIIATTHLKAAKTAKGERTRHLETELLLSAIDRCATAVLQRHSIYSIHSVPIVLAADLNAVPTKCSVLGYESTVYPYIKQHPWGYRSVLNDDAVVRSGDHKSDSNIDTCAGVVAGAGVGAGSDCDGTVDTRVGDNGGGNVTVDSICAQKGSATHNTINNNNNDMKCNASATDSDANTVSLGGSGEEDAVWTTWKARCKLGAELVIKHCIDYILYATARAQPSTTAHSTTTALSTSMHSNRTCETATADIHSSAHNSVTTTSSAHSDRPAEEYVIRAVAALSPVREEHVGRSLLPNEHYPSDHVAIAADLQVLRKT